MLSHETLGHNELRVDRRSLEHKKMQLELLGKMAMLSNKCSLYMTFSKCIFSSTCANSVTKASKPNVLPTSPSEFLALQLTFLEKCSGG